MVIQTLAAAIVQLMQRKPIFKSWSSMASATNHHVLTHQFVIVLQQCKRCWRMAKVRYGCKY